MVLRAAAVVLVPIALFAIATGGYTRPHKINAPTPASAKKPAPPVPEPVRVAAAEPAVIPLAESNPMQPRKVKTERIEIGRVITTDDKVAPVAVAPIPGELPRSHRNETRRGAPTIAATVPEEDTESSPQAPRVSPRHHRPSRARAQVLRGGDICARHNLRKVVTNGGRSWRCRR